MRVPKKMMMQQGAGSMAYLAYDSFNRVNGPVGSTEANGPLGMAPVLPWIDKDGTFRIVVNQANPIGWVSAGIVVVNIGQRNVVVSAELTIAANTAGVVASFVDTTNYLLAYHNGVSAGLYMFTTTGGAVSLISQPAAYAAGRVIQLTVNGTDVSLYYNGVQIGLTQTINDAQLLPGIYCGMRADDINNYLDNFTAVKP